MGKKRYSTKEIAAMLHVDESTVRKWILSGKLHGDNSNSSNQWFVDLDNLEEFVKKKPKYASALSLALGGAVGVAGAASGFGSASVASAALLSGGASLSFGLLPLGLAGITVVGLSSFLGKSKKSADEKKKIRESFLQLLSVNQSFLDKLNTKNMLLIQYRSQSSKANKDALASKIADLDFNLSEFIVEYGSTFFSGAPIIVVPFDDNNIDSLIQIHSSLVELYLSKSRTISEILSYLHEKKTSGNEEQIGILTSKLEGIVNKEVEAWNNILKNNI